jgi:hypothetical protein
MAQARGPARMTVALALPIAGGGIFRGKLTVGDPRVTQLRKAVLAFDRSRYGFWPLPTAWNPHRQPPGTSGGKTSRTITFRQGTTSYRWIDEPEIFKSPKEYRSVDGTFKEQECPTCEIEDIPGVPPARSGIRAWPIIEGFRWPMESLSSLSRVISECLRNRKRSTGSAEHGDSV